MAWFGRVSTRGGASALILATSAGVLFAQLAHSTTSATAAVASKTTEKIPATAVFGQSVALTAAVTPTPSSTAGLQFLDNGAPISPVRHSTTGRYSFSTTALGMGSHSIVASFSDPSGVLMPSQSAPATLTVNQAGTGTATIVLTSNPPSPITGGTPVTFTAQLTGTAGLPTPTGSVTFKNGTGVISAGRSVVNGAATVPVGSLPLGTNTISAAYSGDGSYAPLTATLAVVVNAAPNDKFLTHLYTDMIGQQDASGEAYWASQLSKGAARPAVAFAFTQTLAYDNAVVSQLYTNIMQRPAASDPGGANFWAGQLRNGSTPERVAASMVASDERFNSPTFGQGNPDTWIRATYRALLGRDWDASGAAYWHDFLMGGGPRWQLTLDFVSGSEWAGVTVTTMYSKFHLGTPDPGALAYWSQQVMGGMRDDQLASQLTGSQQYFDWTQTH